MRLLLFLFLPLLPVVEALSVGIYPQELTSQQQQTLVIINSDPHELSYSIERNGAFHVEPFSGKIRGKGKKIISLEPTGERSQETLVITVTEGDGQQSVAIPVPVKDADAYPGESVIFLACAFFVATSAVLAYVFFRLS